MIKQPETLKAIPNWAEQACFGCGPANDHGLKMKFFTDNQRIYSFLKVPETMTGWDRIIHGGVLSTIVDEVMGWAAIYLYKQLGVTKTITVDFKKPVLSGERITAVASIQEKISDTAVLMFAKIYNSAETVCVEAEGQFKLISPRAAMHMGLVGEDYIKTFGPILEFDYDA